MYQSQLLKTSQSQQHLITFLIQLAESVMSPVRTLLLTCGKLKLSKQKIKYKVHDNYMYKINS